MIGRQRRPFVACRRHPPVGVIVLAAGRPLVQHPVVVTGRFLGQRESASLRREGVAPGPKAVARESGDHDAIGGDLFDNRHTGIGAGVAGVAIGFAAKDTLSNLIAGVLLIIDRPFEVGDRIEVWNAPAGTASWGDVIDIGLRATKIKTTDNIVIIIPNNEIMVRDIVNYTTITEKIRLRINIGIAYDADMQSAKDIILKVADSAQWVAKQPPPAVVVRNFGDSSVDLQLRVWIEDARNRMRTISYITDQVKTDFDKQGIEIPYPKRDIYIKGKI